MNKKTIRIAGWALGLSMAVAGIGLAVGVSQKAPIEANAVAKPADSTITATWTASSGALGGKISTVGGTSSGTFNVTDASSNNYQWSYTRTLMSGEDSVGWQSNCIQLGKNGGVENIVFSTSNIPGIIKSVSIQTSSYSGKHKVAITVGETTYKAATNTKSWTTVGEISGTGTSQGAISINVTNDNAARAFYVKSISVTFSKVQSITGVTSVYTGDSTPALSSDASTTVSWSSSDTGVATVNSSTGVVTGVSAGTAYIYAAATGYATATHTITVSDAPTDPYITVTPTSLSGYTGGSDSLLCSSGNLSGTLTWETSNPSVATISSTTGSSITVSYVGAGNATIKAFDSAAKATVYQDISVSVTASAVNSITISSTSKALHIGDTFKLSATVDKVGVKSTDVTWSSSDEEVATVSKTTASSEEEITISTLKVGTVRITATSVGDGTKTAYCDITISPQPIYQKVTSAPADWRGTYLVVCESKNYAFNGSLASPDADNNNVAVEISEGKITGTSAINAAVITIGRYVENDTNYYYAKTSSGKYFGRNGTSNGFDLSDSTKFAINPDSNGSDGYTIKGSEDVPMQVYSSNNKFRFYASDQTAVSLYRMNVDDAINTEVSNYSTSFLSTMTCSGTGSVTAESGSWDAMKTQYESLSMDAQRELALKTGDKTGAGVDGAIGRYDEIIKKHGTSDYPDFMFRIAANKLSLTPAEIIAVSTERFDDSLPLIITVASLGVLTAGGLFLVQRKRRQD